MPVVKQLDEHEAKRQLKNCPKIVQDYVKCLQRSNEAWKDIAYKAIGKLKEASK